MRTADHPFRLHAQQGVYKYVSALLVLFLLSSVVWINPSKLRIVDFVRDKLDLEDDDIVSAQHRTSKERMATVRSEQEEACSNLPQSINKFVQDIHEDPETRGLRRWVFHPSENMAIHNNPHAGVNILDRGNDNKKPWIFPPFSRDLLDSAFAGKRIAIVGDSTTFYLMRWIHHALRFIPAGYLDRLGDRNATPAHRAAEDFMKKALPCSNIGVEDVEEYYYENKAHFTWKGFNGGSIDQNCDFDRSIWPSLLEFKPEIIVANWGIHTLMTNPTNAKVCNIYQYLNIETFFLEKVIKIAQEVGTKLILFKTTNLVCDAEQKPKMSCKYYLPKWLQSPGELAAYSLTPPDLDEYCKKALRSESSAALLNDRLRAFVDRYNGNENKSNTHNMKVAIYNDHDMERCDYTQWNDGTHFQLMAFPRIRLLAHMINCLWQG